VALPPWAHSPEHFLQLQRAALESPTVSRSLHHWVDLVFGAKQRGPAALEADNVFYHLTYEGAVNIGAVDNPVERKALVTQVGEVKGAAGLLLVSCCFAVVERAGPHAGRGSALAAWATACSVCVP
jgi:hypothetical protein